MILQPMIVDDVLRIFYVATDAINPGDELLASYGSDYCNNAGIYVECKCKSTKCSSLISVSTSRLAHMTAWVQDFSHQRNFCR